MVVRLELTRSPRCSGSKDMRPAAGVQRALQFVQQASPQVPARPLEARAVSTRSPTPFPPLCPSARRSFVNSVTDKLTGAVSLSAAVFSSVLIASCLPSEVDVVRPRVGPARSRDAPGPGRRTAVEWLWAVRPLLAVPWPLGRPAPMGAF